MSSKLNFQFFLFTILIFCIPQHKLIVSFARHKSFAVKTDRFTSKYRSGPLQCNGDATQRQINPNLNKMFEWPDARPIYFDCVPRRFDFIKGCVLLQSAMVEINRNIRESLASVYVNICRYTVHLV